MPLQTALGLEQDRQPGRRLRRWTHSSADQGSCSVKKRTDRFGWLIFVAVSVLAGGAGAEEGRGAARGGNFHNEDKQAGEEQIPE